MHTHTHTLGWWVQPGSRLHTHGPLGPHLPRAHLARHLRRLSAEPALEPGARRSLPSQWPEAPAGSRPQTTPKPTRSTHKLSPTGSQGRTHMHAPLTQPHQGPCASHRHPKSTTVVLPVKHGSNKTPHTYGNSRAAAVRGGGRGSQGCTARITCWTHGCTWGPPRASAVPGGVLIQKTGQRGGWSGAHSQPGWSKRGAPP